MYFYWLGRWFLVQTSDEDDKEIEHDILEIRRLLDQKVAQLIYNSQADIVLRMQATKLIYEPSKWHACTKADWQTCDKAANCYSYALNNPKYYWSQPGMGFIKTDPLPYIDSFNVFFKDYSLKEFMDFMIKGAVSDGLIKIDGLIEREGYYPVALFFKDHPSNFDLHWYRRDDDGAWSRKNGWEAVTNRDSRGKVITDVSEAPDPDFPIFGSYFLVPREGILLTKKFLIPTE